jgi:hypothetical protein
MNDADRLRVELDAWKELAEALAQTARGRHLGLVKSLGRLKAAKDRLRELGIEPPVEPEFDPEELVVKVTRQERR